MAVSLSVLRILARQMSGCGPIVDDEGLSTLGSLAGHSGRGMLKGVVKPELTGTLLCAHYCKNAHKRQFQ